MMKKIVLKKHLLTVLIILCLTCSLWAQQLTLAQAQERAVENSINVEMSKNSLQKAVNNAEVKGYLPTFSLSGSVSENLDLTDDVSYSLKHPAIGISAGVNWNISNQDKMTSLSNDLSLRQASLSLEKTVAAIRSNVMTSYYKLVSLGQSIRQAQSSVDNARFSYERTLDLYENSKASELSLLQAQMSYEDSLFALENAKTSYGIALDSFRTLTGIEEEFTLEDIPETDGLDFTRLNGVSEKYINETTSVRSAELSLESAQLANKKSVMNNRTPSVSLKSNLGFGIQKNNKKDKFEDSLTLSATVTASVPLDSYFSWTSAHASLLNSEIDIDNAVLSLDSAADSISSNVDQVISSLKTYVSKTENLKAHLKLSEQNYDLVLEAYENGYASYSDLNNARVSLENAQTALTNNKMNIINQLCSFASLLELDMNSVMEYLK